jgi:hypothetical protein
MATGYNLDLHYQIKQAIIQGITSLNLEKIGINVYDLMVKDMTNVSLPAVNVCIEDDVEEPMPGDTETTDWWYPVSVYIFGRISVHDTTEQKWLLEQRAAIMKSFDQRNLANLPTTVMYVTPRPIFDPIKDQYQTLITGLTIRVWASEPRVKTITQP